MKTTKKYDCNDLYYGITIIVSLILLFPMLYIAKYCRASADDFGACLQTYPAFQSGAGFFGVLKAAIEHTILEYNIWQGLYTSEFLFSLHPGVFGEKYYVLTPLIIFTIMFICLYISIRIINIYTIKRSKLHSIMNSTVLLLFFALWLPCPNEGIYWFSGGINYIPWVFCSLLESCLIFHAYFQNKKICVFIASILAFVISGSHLVTAFENILLLIVISIILFKRKSLTSLFPLLIGLLGFYLNLSAPGTLIRSGYFQRQTLKDTIFMVIMRFYKDLGSWINVQWVLLMIIATPVMINIALKSKKIIKGADVALSILVCSIIYCGMLSVPFYSRGDFGSGRLNNVLWISFIIFSLWNYSLLWIWLIQSGCIQLKPISQNQDLKIRVGILICLVMLFALPNIEGYNTRSGFVIPVGYSNSIKAITELLDGSARTYAAELDERTILYKDPNVSEVVVDALTVKPELLYFRDLGTDITQFPNTSISSYYGKKIYLKSE